MTEIVARACAAAQAQQAARICTIHLVCGAVSGVVPDCLRFCFDVCTAGTLAEGATLAIETVPAQWRCGACGHVLTGAAETMRCVCPACQAQQMVLTAGRELCVRAIEVE
jgi:hydrogenase nickel incorporation protein HypA/HybF